MVDPIPLQPAWVYGPIDSRRLGRSLGVNLLPTGQKVCTMDCIYCQYGSTRPAEVARVRFPTVSDVLDAVEQALQAPGAPLEAISLAGNGEPTLHPDLAEIVEGLSRLRDRHAPQAKLCLLSNGARLDRPGVRAALRWIDLPVFKLDAGDEATVQVINRSRCGSLAGLVACLESLTHCVLQSMFVTGYADNATPGVLASWLDQVQRIQPQDVQVTTVDRGTAAPNVLSLPQDSLERIVDLVRERGIQATAYPCRDMERFGAPDPGGEVLESSLLLPPPSRGCERGGGCSHSRDGSSVIWRPA